ncbi:MAG: hypothetical protein IKA20_00115 [Clostridia bacterium]|nr:hypothetical protein [Clostridia bacterium]
MEERNENAHNDNGEVVMTEEILKSITVAEEEAAQIKCEAQENAARILSGAQSKADEIAKNTAEECKTYREAQIKKAQEDAEKEYTSTLKVKTEEAKAYCAEALENAESTVSTIVGRIVSGNR